MQQSALFFLSTQVNKDGTLAVVKCKNTILTANLRETKAPKELFEIDLPNEVKEKDENTVCILKHLSYYGTDRDLRNHCEN